MKWLDPSEELPVGYEGIVECECHDGSRFVARWLYEPDERDDVFYLGGDNGYVLQESVKRWREFS